MRRVDRVPHRNDAHAVLREIAFQIASGFQIIPPQTGQIFDENEIDAALRDFAQHFLELRSVEGRPGNTVICIFRYDRPALPQSVVVQQPALIGDALALSGTAGIIAAETKIQRRAAVCLRRHISSLYRSRIMCSSASSSSFRSLCVTVIPPSPHHSRNPGRYDMEHAASVPPQLLKPYVFCESDTVPEKNDTTLSKICYTINRDSLSRKQHK